MILNLFCCLLGSVVHTRLSNFNDIQCTPIIIAFLELQSCQNTNTIKHLHKLHMYGV